MKDKILKYADTHHESRVAWGESDCSESFHLSAVATFYRIRDPREVAELEQAAAELVEAGLIVIEAPSFEESEALYSKPGTIKPAIVSMG